MSEQSEITSKQWWLDHKDFFKGLIVAALTTPLTIIGQSISAGNFTFDWKAILGVAVSAGAAYLMKNFATPSKTVTPNK